MKTIISDYDGTIKKYDNKINELINLKKNIKSINKFIKKGNIFVIATGRTTTSILNEINNLNINYNYLITYGGSVILNKNKILYANYLNKDFIKEIYNLYLNSNDIKKIDIFNEYGYATTTDNLIQLKIKLDINNNTNLLNIYNKYKDLEIFFSNESNEYFIKNKTDKSQGIETLLNLLDNNKEEIYTIGNSFSDLKMINNYNGYCIKDSEIDKYYNIENVKNIKQLIKKIK